jgi:hypothetical protein
MILVTGGPGFYRVAHRTGTARPGRIRRALSNCVSIRFRLVADAFGAPVLRDQGPIGQPASHGKGDRLAVVENGRTAVVGTRRGLEGTGFLWWPILT